MRQPSQVMRKHFEDVADGSCGIGSGAISTPHPHGQEFQWQSASTRTDGVFFCVVGDATFNGPSSITMTNDRPHAIETLGVVARTKSAFDASFDILKIGAFKTFTSAISNFAFDRLWAIDHLVASVFGVAFGRRTYDLDLTCEEESSLEAGRIRAEQRNHRVRLGK